MPNVLGEKDKMPSIKRLSSVCHSIAHHAVSGLSYVHPHLRQACKAIGIDTITIDLMREQPCPDRFLNIEPLRMSLKALQDKFEEILTSEGFTKNEIGEINLKFEFTEEFLDDYCSNCYARLVSKNGKVFERAVNYMGKTIRPTRE
jgi:hypothetical protein